MRKYISKNSARWVLLVLIAITSVAAYQLKKLSVSYDFEAFFPKNDANLNTYRQHTKTFGTDNDFVLIAVESDHLFDKKLNELDAFTKDLKTSDFITQATSITTLKQTVISPLGVYQTPYITFSGDSTIGFNRLLDNRAIAKSFISKDTTATLVLIETEPNLSKEKSDQALQGIYRVLKKHHSLGKFHIAGRIHGQHYFIELMFTELLIFGLSSVVLLALFLFISFRTLWGIFIPIAIVLGTVIWLLGGLSGFDRSISMLTTIMPTILFVVGVSDVIHFIEKYLETLRNGLHKKEALYITIKEIGLATFLTSLTTSVGFLTLLTSNMTPVQEFGSYTSIGVWFAYILAFTATPALLYLLPLPKIAFQKKNLFWQTRLRTTFIFVLRNPKKIMLSNGVIILLAFIGLSRIDINNYLLEDLNEKDPVKQSYLYFETAFDGVRPFEMSLAAKDSSITLTYGLVKDLFTLENYLLETYELKNVISISTLIAELNVATHGGNQNFRRLPTKNEWQIIKRYLNQKNFKNKAKNILASDFTQLRFTGRVADYGGKIFTAKNKNLEAFWNTTKAAKKYQLNVTGMASLIDRNNQLLAKNMLIGLLIAFGIIAIIMGWLYKSVRYIAIALIPNMLPLIIIAGVMGFSGIDLKVSTSLIFTIAFGIAVDDTIHFLSKLNIELNKGRSLIYALKRTFFSTGKAIIVTSIILCAGFWTLLFSSFASTFYVGLLISLTLLFAVLSDLFVLPILVLNWHKKSAD